MKILAFDSTAKSASVAVADGTHVLSEFTVDSGMTQSELLLPMARKALEAAHISLSEIELFALTTGPGSFTGVRIGAALVKGIAFGKNIPCVSVSTLEALAEKYLGEFFDMSFVDLFEKLGARFVTKKDNYALCWLGDVSFSLHLATKGGPAKIGIHTNATGMVLID